MTDTPAPVQYPILPPGVFLLFQPTDELVAAVAVFVERYGTQPVGWARWAGGLGVGPCPEEERE
jgi:hypothetical protein